jgi:hypothetical protein
MCVDQGLGLRAALVVVDFAAMRRGALGLFLLVLASSALAADTPNLDFLLEAPLPPIAGQVPEAAPARFVLLDDGRVFLGGTSDVLEGRLTGATHKELRSEAARLRKLKGLRDRLEFGPGEAQFRLRLGKAREFVATGDPDLAPPAARPVAAFIQKLLRFDDPSLRPYRAERYQLVVRTGQLIGGCRPWTLPLPLAEAVAGPQVVPAAAAASWPTGALAASVCSGDRTFVVTLRPLLPWEHR